MHLILMFTATYYQKVDSFGHSEGPDGETLKEEIRRVDSELLRVQNELESKGLWNTVNLMVFSDHGMMHVPKEAERCIDFKQYINEADIFKAMGSGSAGPVVLLWPTEGKEDEVGTLKPRVLLLRESAYVWYRIKLKGTFCIPGVSCA